MGVSKFFPKLALGRGTAPKASWSGSTLSIKSGPSVIAARCHLPKASLGSSFLLLAVLLLTAPAIAAEKKPPYWASIASGQAMMRTGPARNYPGVWLYQRRDLPVRVVAVYETWRKIEDPAGQQGWMLVTMLSDKRSVVMKAGGAKAIRNKPDSSSHVAYQAEAGVVGKVDHCREGWCHIAMGKREGYVAVGDVWGVSEGETVD